MFHTVLTLHGVLFVRPFDSSSEKGQDTSERFKHYRVKGRFVIIALFKVHLILKWLDIIKLA